ncbi:MAG: DegT/DnrJ/EryC1/StrS family aminotransferase [Hymenobacter sp.]
MHLGLILLGVGPGDEVLCPSFTFVATANAHSVPAGPPAFSWTARLKPGTCAPARLREAIEDRIDLGKKPKALLLVHLYGMPAQLTEILALAAEYELPILEDAAEALGAQLQQQPLGGFGRGRACSPSMATRF